MKQSTDDPNVQRIQSQIAGDPRNPQHLIDLAHHYLETDATKQEALEPLHRAVELCLNPGPQSPYPADRGRASSLLKQILEIAPDDARATELAASLEKNPTRSAPRKEPLEPAVRRILILSNHDREPLREFLEKKAFAVQTAPNSLEIKGVFERLQPALILIDRIFEPLAYSDFGDLPVIFLTSPQRTEQDDFSLPSSLNIEDYVDHTVAFEPLLETIERCLYRRARGTARFQVDAVETPGGVEPVKSLEPVQPVKPAEPREKATPPEGEPVAETAERGTHAEAEAEPPEEPAEAAAEAEAPPPAAPAPLEPLPEKIELERKAVAKKEKEIRESLARIEALRKKWEEASLSTDWKLKYAEELGRNVALEHENTKLLQTHLDAQKEIWTLEAEVRQLCDERDGFKQYREETGRMTVELEEKVKEIREENLRLTREKNNADTEIGRVRALLDDSIKEKALLGSEIENVSRESRLHDENRKFFENELQETRKKLLATETEYRATVDQSNQQSERLQTLMEEIVGLERERKGWEEERVKLRAMLSTGSSAEGREASLAPDAVTASRRPWGKLVLAGAILVTLCIVLFLLARYAFADNSAGPGCGLPGPHESLAWTCTVLLHRMQT